MKDETSIDPRNHGLVEVVSYDHAVNANDPVFRKRLAIMLSGINHFRLKAPQRRRLSSHSPQSKYVGHPPDRGVLE